MKKTLITLLALGGLTMGTDLTFSDFADVSSVERETYANITSMFTHTTANQITVAITFNIDAFKAYVIKDAALSKEFIINIHDKGNGSFGLNTNYSSYDHDNDSSTTNIISTSGLYGNSGGANGGATKVGVDSGLQDATMWATATGASLVLTLDRKSWTGKYVNDDPDAGKVYTDAQGVTAVFTVKHQDGTYTQIGDGTWWANVNQDKPNQIFDEIYLDSSVELAYMANGAITLGNAKTLGKYFASIPEPTTATLSLLALAGLCARRRRK